MEFKTVRTAKDYLATKITDQAKLEGTPLTEVERKMLYFSEDGGLSTAMAAVSEQFDRDYNQDEYEERIGGLVNRLLARTDAPAQQQDWDDAAIKLCDGDNYLTVLINTKPASAGWLGRSEKLRPWLPTWDPRAKRDGKDFLRMMIFILAGSFLMFMLVLLKNSFR